MVPPDTFNNIDQNFLSFVYCKTFVVLKSITVKWSCRFHIRIKKKCIAIQRENPHSFSNTVSQRLARFQKTNILLVVFV